MSITSSSAELLQTKYLRTARQQCTQTSSEVWPTRLAVHRHMQQVRYVNTWTSALRNSKCCFAHAHDAPYPVIKLGAAYFFFLEQRVLKLNHKDMLSCVRGHPHYNYHVLPEEMRHIPPCVNHLIISWTHMLHLGITAVFHSSEEILICHVTSLSDAKKWLKTVKVVR